MPRITRRQCGCTCSNRATWTPQGTALPSAMCSACTLNPCEYLVDFGCYGECNGLKTSYHTAVTGQRELLSLAKDGCFFEDVCRWSFKQSKVGVSETLSTLMLFRKIGFWGECNYPTLPPSTSPPSWSKFFKVIGSTILTAAGKAIAIPRFGCKRQSGWSIETGLPNLLGGIDDPCGWYDLRGMTCAMAAEWLAFLASADTFDRWKLELSGSTATLTGVDDDGDTLIYRTDNWVCPTLDAPDPRNRLFMVGYPGTLCPGQFPKSVCVFPGYTNLKTCCSSTTAMIACCDPNQPYACLTLPSDPACGITGGPITLFRYHPDCDDLEDFFGGGGPPAGPRPAFPDDITPPSTSCGYFWGEFNGCSPVRFGLMTYCSSGTWKVRLYGNIDNAGWDLIGEVDVTNFVCCPWATFEFAFPTIPEEYCPCDDTGIETDCCPDDPVPTTLFLTLGGCLSGSATLTWNAGASAWQGTDGDGRTWSFRCEGGGEWRLTNITCLPFGADSITVDCDPFLVTLSGPVNSTCCPPSGGTGDFTVSA